MIELIKAHGNLNDVILVPKDPDRLFVSTAERTQFIQKLCDRRGMYGADGVYFIDVERGEPEAKYYNADGSYAEYCGNGMRCAGRWLLEYFNADSVAVYSGGTRFEVSFIQDISEGVPTVEVKSERPVRFMRFGASESTYRETRILRYSDTLRFTAFNGPNPHLVSLVDTYDEELLKTIALRADSDRGHFGRGVNTSFVARTAGESNDFFVRTFERGAGLTPSCASGAVASAAMLVAQGYVKSGQPMRIRNVGGPIDVMIEGTEDDLYPTQSGDATFVYRTNIEPAALLSGNMDMLRGDVSMDEIEAYGQFHTANVQRLVDAGIAISV